MIKSDEIHAESANKKLTIDTEHGSSAKSNHLHIEKFVRSLSLLPIQVYKTYESHA